MPIKTPHTKAERQAVVHQEMHAFKEGQLHSGSKHGPIVKNRKQAVAIAMSESGQSNKQKGHAMKKESSKMPAGQPADPTHHSLGYSHLRRQTGFGRGESPSVPQKGMSMERAKSIGTEQREHHTTMRSMDGFHDGTAAESNQHVGNGKTMQKPGPSGHTFVDHYDHGDGVKAEHHPPMSREPHRFDRPASGPTSGFRHGAHQRAGALRLSGIPGAHRIGKR